MAAEAPATVQGTRVLLRVRPLNSREKEERSGGTARCLELPADRSSALYCGPDAPPNPSFSFDRVLGEDASQAAAFEEVSDIVRAVLEGYNGTVLAFGQTGSGKTHTLLGEVGHPQERGIVPRAVAELARGIAASPDPRAFRVTLSVVEIYCERIKDLLCPERDNLQVMQDRDRGMFVEGATSAPVSSEAECVRLMQAGIAARAVSATAMNAGSSRSHCVVTLVVERQTPDGGVALSKLCLVDLAGSERQDKTGSQGQTLTEGSQINKSLSTLSNVIAALTDPARASGKGPHVPYRDSKLTRMLQDSLGGTSRTVLLVCASPSAFNALETLSSLRFGARARGMQSTVTKAEVRRSPEQLAKMLTAAQAECVALKAELEASKGGCSGSKGSQTGGEQLPAAAAAAAGVASLEKQQGIVEGMRMRSALAVVAVQALGVLLYCVADEWLAAAAC